MKSNENSSKHSIQFNIIYLELFNNRHCPKTALEESEGIFKSQVSKPEATVAWKLPETS